MQMPFAGDTFEGKYELQQLLGKGGFATVFRATDTELGRDVAIKILSPHDGAYPEKVVARFLVEARVLAGLQDPHTIKLFEFGESADGLLYMVFQYVSGLDLAVVLRRRGPLPADVVVHITRQVLLALTEAHGAGILHRDLKPANVLVHEYMGDEYSTKLLDFGIAKVDQEGSAAGLTKTGTLLGTLRYMSPEQVFGEKLTPASDIYSLGLIAYEMLVGRPAVGGSQQEILKQQISDAPFVLPEGVGWRTLRQVVERMLAREPSQRYAKAIDALSALDYARRHRDDEQSGSGAMTPWPEPHRSESTSGFSDRPATNSVERRQRRDRGRGLLLGSIGACALVAMLGVYLTREKPSARQPVKPTALPEALLETRTATPDPSATAEDLGPADIGVREPEPEPVDAGCGKPFKPQPGEKTWVEVSTDGARRKARVFVPPQYDPNERHPLIIALQPRHIDEGQYAARAKFHEFKKGPIVVAVAALDRLDPWTAASDLPILRQVVNAAADHWCVDRTRVFVAGHGEGASMARDLACSMPLSGIAVSGNSEVDGYPSCEPSPPIPMLFVAARRDPVVPLRGGDGCLGTSYLGAREHDELWKQRHGCHGEPTVWFEKQGEGSCETWTCSEAAYASCRAAGGHRLKKTRWSMFEPSGCDAPPLAMKLGPVIWSFFEKHGRTLDKPLR